ncbi:MAG TPA: glutamate synthase subunit beta [Dehalococcoidia bacterium]|nr:glutamate synthase subunit beta [Dehalococcoidia bacterium]
MNGHKPDKLTGFMTLPRETPKRRPVPQRLKDWQEVYLPMTEDKLQGQAARCMDCGIPFCHQGCPLGNLIPEWNDLVYRNHWEEALDRLHRTNNFPEFTGRLCPAPCEGSCVLGINRDPVTIKQIEVSIIDYGFDAGFVKPDPPAVRTGKKVAVVGSGPAGLAAAEQLNRAGHLVTVFERDDRIGGLLRYGIPEFKMEKRVLDRRLDLMAASGVTFETNANVGIDVDAKKLKKDFDAIVLTGGATLPRDLRIPGRDLDGIHFAMDYLTLQNRRCEGDDVADDEFITAKGKKVVIIGGGDTGADCLGTVHRQRAASVHQFELLARPPDEREPLGNPWPSWPNIFRTSSAHEEGGEREYQMETLRFEGNGSVQKLVGHRVNTVFENGRMSFEPIPDSLWELEADLVLLAMGFLGPEKDGVIAQLDVELDGRGNVVKDENWMTNVSGVFTAGDMTRGQSLIVWAIAEGRSAAEAVDRYLMGESALAAPLSAVANGTIGGR